VEAPVGQKVSITILDFTASSSQPDSLEQSKMSCQSHGVIVDKVRKQNTSICGGSQQREKDIYLSAGNMVQIILNQDQTDTFNGSSQFLLRIQGEMVMGDDDPILSNFIICT